MSRQRSHCVIKKPKEEKIIHQINDVIEEDVKEEIETINDKFNKDQKVIARESLYETNDLNNLNLKTPVFKNIKYEFPSKSNKVMYLHEKANFFENFNRSQVEEIEHHSQVINFYKFLQQFKTEEEVHNLELQDILDIDYDKLNEIKEKSLEFIDAASLLCEEFDQQGKDIENISELLFFFSNKLNEMKSNEINLQIFTDNLDRVKVIHYTSNGVKVFFQNK
jgi:hypothetical protein